MKNIFTVLLLILSFSACSKKDEGKALPVDQEKLDSASQVYCPTNQKFRVFTGDIWLGKSSLPTPILFAIQKGSGRCASLNNIDHGGLSSWLN
ncbi:MAG: hypothetical protein ACXWRU_16955, partial [Pseudobdellovibrionaceae bacterium]